MVSLLGFYGAYLYGHKTHNFRWSEYFAIIIVPLICVGVLAYFYGLKILVFFAASCLIGFVFELVFGFIYHKVLNARLWTYHKLSVKGYSSLLSILPWGVTGVVIYFVSKILGL